jgi:hypothetical protein
VAAGQSLLPGFPHEVAGRSLDQSIGSDEEEETIAEGLPFVIQQVERDPALWAFFGEHILPGQQTLGKRPDARIWILIGDKQRQIL